MGEERPRGGYVELVDWRRRVGGLYAAVRAADDPADGHEVWRRGRDRLFREHPQSPLLAGDPLRGTGLPYWPYDPRLRFAVPLWTVDSGPELVVPSGGDGDTRLLRVGYVEVPAPVNARLDVWWLHQYGGGLFVPVRDGTAGDGSYGGGRYLLDTAKGADLGGHPDLVLDFNFLYHPSCRYNPEWVCPLAPEGNRITVPLRAGEQL
ncbi:MAG: uncharacterized protein V7637_4745 [Mycobacteriales bacterium]|jgi:uncharacterized protein (DUF1684 family)